ncbi:glycoside hydrolase 15-related protein [Haloterrigena turkmenica DSM 5511]|uniref:Glycoside hydrolase 15-related protein n=1 Tax=Haloterrigena turkmenica (strain ATCC 51198 / DSM 5511 / JCM 9101 / NCIMB 13204 / VKM B-1734 / 4k) TaxID=543526 RepID=D2RWW3_HALTV|nr:glycoside hydrolase family 15 protein [Haloterrigena turkmenica]ADB61614.1 glycoside hydrolase 15-related protein [Haloterrigena turkmenica DSM 5511]
MRDDDYPPIEAYGVVGNLETCALVAPDGSVDWFPFPHLESPSIFAAVLDAERGGRFRIAPTDSFETDRRYVDDTNVLETSFRTDGGTATVTDFLPPAGRTDHPKKVLYRKLACDEGRVDLAVDLEPRFDYARAETTVESEQRGALAEGRDERTLLESPIDLEIEDDRVTGELSLETGDEEWFLLRCTGAEDANTDPEAALEESLEYWSDWAHDCGADGDCVFEGAWHDRVVRSELVLKLLTHAESGAIAAAPTTSLPEDIGGVRNWDYRFNWLRDAGFTVQALMNLGTADEATAYFEWFMDLCQADDPAAIQPLYGLHGESDLEERELEHFEGYRGSSPVRIGNEAADQRQHDTYGELLLAVDEMHRHGRELDPDEWDRIRDIVDYVREIWDEPDAGIWEVRGGDEHFVYSKVMCWVALDRGIALATDGGYDAPVGEWRETCERIRADVLENGYDEDVGAFVQSYGSNALDATGLLLPIVGFLPFGDDRIRETIDAIEETLVEDGVFVQRYDGDDGLPGEEGAFVLCSCWFVDALALSGRVAEAQSRFETLLEYLNPLGLIAEEIDPESGAHLGNFPQAFSHIGIVNSALYLGYLRGHEAPGPAPMGIRLGEPVGLPSESSDRRY